MVMQSEILIKRNVQLPDRRTSVQLESYIWQSIDAILSLEAISLSLLCAELDQRKADLKLAGSIRIFALIYFRTLSGQLSEQASESHMLHSRRLGISTVF